jgi:EAL domain-containing protein (putative c-di-GMP-specific phosphodiesterase class I)
MYEKRTFESVINQKPYWGEACYMSKKSGANVFIIKTSPKTHWACAGADPDGNKLFDSIKKKHSLTDLETVRFLAYRTKEPDSSENDLIFKAKVYSEHSRVKGAEEKKYWAEEIDSAIKESRIQVRAEPVASTKDDKAVGYEIFSQIVHHDGTTSSYGTTVKWLETFARAEEYNKIVYRRAFKYFENVDIDIYVNFNSNEIKNEEFIYDFLSIVVAFRMEKKLVVELKDTFSNNNINELKTFIARMKEAGIRVAIDNVGIHYHKMSYLVILDIDYINIDKGLLEAKDGDPATNVLDMIIAFSKHGGKENKKKLVALKVETKEELLRAKEKGFDNYQGWILKDEQIII